MKLVVVCPEYLPFPGGAEKTLHELLLDLHGGLEALDVVVPAGGADVVHPVAPTTQVIDGIHVRHVALDRYAAEVERACAAADVVLLQQLFVFRTVKDIPIDRVLARFVDRLVYVASVDPGLLGDCVSARLTLCCSDWQRRQLPASIEAVRVHPLMTLAQRVAPSGVRRPAVAMVNPERMKGGEVFREIAARLPDETFLGQLGRSAPVRGLDLPNVELLPAVADIHPLYARTDILLVPSRCTETFGRVALEAALAGCLVLCHRIAGMAELPLPEECFVDDLDPATWVARIAAWRALAPDARLALATRIARATEAFDTGWPAGRAAVLALGATPRAAARDDARPDVPTPFTTVEAALRVMHGLVQAKRPFWPLLAGAHRFCVQTDAGSVEDWTFVVAAESVTLERDRGGTALTTTRLTAQDLAACVAGSTCFEHAMNDRRRTPPIVFEGPRPVGNRLSLLFTALVADH